MIKGMVVDESMSNLTSASNEASISSTSNNPAQPAAKKKRNLPGNPGMYVIILFTATLSNSINYLLRPLHHRTLLRSGRGKWKVRFKLNKSAI